MIAFLLCVVFQVSEEDGLTSNIDDVDLDLEEDVGTVDVKVPLKVPAAESDVADEAADKTCLPTASDVDCQDTTTVTPNAGSNDRQNRELTIGATDETKTSESQTCSDSQVADFSLPMTKNIPGKALPVAGCSINPEMPVVDKESEDSVSDPLDTCTATDESVSARSPDLASSAVPVVDSHTTDTVPKNSQQSKKCDNRSVSPHIGFIITLCYAKA